jgi:hypothetical protein
MKAKSAKLTDEEQVSEHIKSWNHSWLKLLRLYDKLF